MSLFKRLFSRKSLLYCHNILQVNKATRTTYPLAKKIENVAEDNENHLIRNLRYVIALSVGIISYKLLNGSICPRVEAAIPIVPIKLKGRRQQFSCIADVVEVSSPAVVFIEIKDTRRVDFFTGRPSTLSNGSGFIIKEDGLILTNAHVVATRPSAKVEVRLLDGTVYSGTVEDIDLQSDLATVRIGARNLPTMPLGNSADLKPGEIVVAIGSPLALSNTVTAGVVSSTQRGADELGIRGKDMVYIQTDAAITFGNSGGPLVNLDGEAIGINSMKVTAGISFAIPIDYVKEFLARVQSMSKAQKEGPKRLFMGITMLTLTPQIIHELQQRQEPVPADVKSGVLVWKVIIGSPAYAGGLQPGDIVTHINGKQISSAHDIYSLLTDVKTKTLRMSVIRAGKRFEVGVTPEDIS